LRISTRLTELLHIKHPILPAPMDIVADGRLAAAVSQAGGFFIIGGGYGDEAWLKREMDAAGGTLVGVGFITWSMARRPKLLDMVLERRPTGSDVVLWRYPTARSKNKTHWCAVYLPSAST
jgi:nitronate monooxygenase